MADMLESHWVPPAKVCVIMTFLTIAPSHAMVMMTIFQQWGISFVGLQPASMTMRFLANTEDGGKDSNSEIKFGGEDAFEDH